MKRPDRVARRATRLVRDEAAILAGRSTIAPARSDRRFADRAWSENPLLQRTMQQYLALTEALDGLVTDAELEWAKDVRARFALEVAVDALAPTNLPWLNPAVLKETLDRGGANLVRGGRRARAGRQGPQAAFHRRQQPLRGGAQHRRHPGRGRAPHRAVRAAAVRAGDRRGGRGAAARGPAGDQPLLRPGPRARPVADRAPRRRRAAGVRHLLAQPGARAGRLRPRRIRRGGARSARRRQRDHGLRAGRRPGRLLGRHRRRLRAQPPRGRRAVAGLRRASRAARLPARRPPGRDDVGAGLARGRRGGRRPVRPHTATSTASRSPASSPGCDRTTSSGTTSSTTTSWARIHRRSTSCTGTRTRCACRPGCTATS